MRSDIRPRLRRALAGAAAVVATTALSTIYSSPALAEESSTTSPTAPLIQLKQPELPRLPSGGYSPNNVEQFPRQPTSPPQVTTQSPTSPPPSPSEYETAEIGATLGGRVWRDSNENGLQDSGEENVTGIRVVVINAATGQPTGQSSETGITGRYNVTNVKGRVYLVFSASNKYAFTTPNAGNNTVDSDVNRSGVSETISTEVGEVLLVDAGLITNGHDGSDPAPTPTPEPPSQTPNPPSNERRNPPPPPNTSPTFSLPSKPTSGVPSQSEPTPSSAPSTSAPPPTFEVRTVRSGALARTGINYMTETIAAAALLLTGGGLLALISRKRQTAANSQNISSDS